MMMARGKGEGTGGWVEGSKGGGVMGAKKGRDEDICNGVNNIKKKKKNVHILMHRN